MHSCTEPNVQCSVPGTTIYVLPYYIHNDSPSWCLICHIIIVIRNPIILSLSYTILASPTASMLSSSCMFKTVPIFSDVSSALFSFASLSSPWFSNTFSLFLSLSLVPWELTAWFNILDNWWICQSFLGTKNWQTPLRHRTAWIQHQWHSQCKMSNLKGPWEREGKASSKHTDNKCTKVCPMAHQADREVILTMLSKTCWTMPSMLELSLFEGLQMDTLHGKLTDWSKQMPKTSRLIWIGLTFPWVAPKKDQMVQFVDNFWELLTNRSRKNVMISNAQNLGHGPESQGLWVCNIFEPECGSLPHGTPSQTQRSCTLWHFLNVKWKFLTMGPCNSPGTLQENVSNQFAELENENECINKLSVKNEKSDLSNHHWWNKPKWAESKVHPKNSYFCQQELEGLGNWVTS